MALKSRGGRGGDDQCGGGWENSYSSSSTAWNAQQGGDKYYSAAWSQQHGCNGIELGNEGKQSSARSADSVSLRSPGAAVSVGKLARGGRPSTCPTRACMILPLSL